MGNRTLVFAFALVVAACSNGNTTRDGGADANDGSPGDARIDSSMEGGADVSSDTAADVATDTADPCSPNPCMNGATCAASGTSATCTCAAGFSGSHCETNIDDCSPNPCMNGGMCTDGANSHTCMCPTGFSGNDCETNIDDCAPSPCMNGGTCVDGVNAHTCTCSSGFSGSDCETNIDDCTPNPCMNGGTCTDGVATHTCACPAGYSGADCETNIDDCTPNPCMNGGTCVDGVASHSCNCPSGFTGANCETVAASCTPNPCLNGGTCTLGSSGYTCACPAGFSGSNCGVNIDDCAPNPCMNGGTCVDGVASHTCMCAAGFSGADCSTNIDDCTPNPCMNGGTCTDGVASHTCSCVGGYTGMNCEVAPARYCDVVYAVGATCAARTGAGRFHNIKTGLGAANTYYDIGTNCGTPRRGTTTGTAVASPFTPAAFPRGYMRLRFRADSTGMAPAAGAVQVVEYYMPIEFTVMGAFSTNVATDVDHSAGLLRYATTGCPTGYSGCLTGASDTVAPMLNRTCSAVANGTVAGTTLSWDTCPVSPPAAYTSTSGTPSTAQLSWSGPNSQDTMSSPGCLANMNTWGGVWCMSGLCGAVPGTGTPSNETWDQHLPTITFSSSNYAATTTTISISEFVVPDGYTDVYSATQLVTASPVHVECGLATAMTCDEQ